MSEKKIKIRIKKDGTNTFEVEGAQGAECETLTEALMRGLGDVEEHVQTHEFDNQGLPDYVEAFEVDE